MTCIQGPKPTSMLKKGKKRIHLLLIETVSHHKCSATSGQKAKVTTCTQKAYKYIISSSGQWFYDVHV